MELLSKETEEKFLSNLELFADVICDDSYYYAEKLKEFHEELKKLQKSIALKSYSIEEKQPENYDVVLVEYDNGTVNTDEYYLDRFKYAEEAGLKVVRWAYMPTSL